MIEEVEGLKMRRKRSFYILVMDEKVDCEEEDWLVLEEESKDVILKVAGIKDTKDLE